MLATRQTISGLFPEAKQPQLSIIQHLALKSVAQDTRTHFHCHLKTAEDGDVVMDEEKICINLLQYSFRVPQSSH